MAIVLALTAAASWGWSDFLGGRTSREEHHVTVALWSQVLGFVPYLVAALAFAPVSVLTATDAAFGAIAGLGGALGLVMLFRGLTVGRMALVAPVTALGAASLPALWGATVDGQLPTPVSGVGLVLALVAIWIISSSHDAEHHGVAPRAAGLPEALAAGVGFAIVLVALDQTTEASRLWPLLPARAVLVTLVLGLAVLRRAPLLPARPATWRPLSAMAVLDTAAISSYLLASQTDELLATVAVVSSLYPAGTVLLARVRLHEHLAAGQLAGLGLAAAAVTLIAIG